MGGYSGQLTGPLGPRQDKKRKNQEDQIFNENMEKIKNSKIINTKEDTDKLNKIYNEYISTYGEDSEINNIKNSNPNLYSHADKYDMIVSLIKNKEEEANLPSGGKSRRYKKKPTRTAKKSSRQRKQTRKRTRKH